MASYKEQIAELAENGYCVIEDIITAEEVENAVGYFR